MRRLVAEGARRAVRVCSARPVATVALALALPTLLHYLSPEARGVPVPPLAALTRSFLERILFVFPAALAAASFGRVGGFLAVGLGVALLLPRALWLSPSAPAALFEAGVAAFLGALVTLLIEARARERALRREATARLGAVHAIAHTVAGSLELDQVLRNALDEVLEVVGFEAGMIFLADPQQRELVLKAHRGVGAEVAATLARIRQEDLCAGADGGEPPVLSGGPWGLDPLEREGIRTRTVVPLRSKKSLQGLLALGTRQRRELTPEELELLSAIGDEIGVAVENAKLHEEIGRQLQVQRQLNEVAERIVSELELDRIMPNVLQIALELTGADAGEVVLADGRGGAGHYCCTPNLPARPAGGPTEAILHYRAMQTREPVLVENYATARGHLASAVGLGIAGVAAVPIVSGQHCFGTLCLFNLNETKRFDASEMAMLAGVGRQTGIALENARLYQSMRFYVRQITGAQEDERKRIARELHDDSIQLLVAISRGLEAVPELAGELPEAVRARLASLQDLLRKAANGMRRFVQDLRPPILDHLGLVACVEGLAQAIEEETGLEATVRVAGSPRRLAPEHELALFRIAQEAISNARRHSHASKAVILLEFLPELVRVTISDDGRGFSAPERIEDLLSEGKLGLVGMHERARTVEGKLRVRSAAGQGTTVVAEVPSGAPP